MGKEKSWRKIFERAEDLKRKKYYSSKSELLVELSEEFNISPMTLRAFISVKDQKTYKDIYILESIEKILIMLGQPERSWTLSEHDLRKIIKKLVDLKKFVYTRSSEGYEEFRK